MVWDAVERIFPVRSDAVKKGWSADFQIRAVKISLAEKGNGPAQCRIAAEICFSFYSQFNYECSNMIKVNTKSRSEAKTETGTRERQ